MDSREAALWYTIGECGRSSWGMLLRYVKLVVWHLKLNVIKSSKELQSLFVLRWWEILNSITYCFHYETLTHTHVLTSSHAHPAATKWKCLYLTCHLVLNSSHTWVCKNTTQLMHSLWFILLVGLTNVSNIEIRLDTFVRVTSGMNQRACHILNHKFYHVICWFRKNKQDFLLGFFLNILGVWGQNKYRVHLPKQASHRATFVALTQHLGNSTEKAHS